MSEGEREGGEDGCCMEAFNRVWSLQRFGPVRSDLIWYIALDRRGGGP